MTTQNRLTLAVRRTQYSPLSELMGRTKPTRPMKNPARKNPSLDCLKNIFAETSLEGLLSLSSRSSCYNISSSSGCCYGVAHSLRLLPPIRTHLYLVTSTTLVTDGGLQYTDMDMVASENWKMMVVVVGLYFRPFFVEFPRQRHHHGNY